MMTSKLHLRKTLILYGNVCICFNDRMVLSRKSRLLQRRIALFVEFTAASVMLKDIVVDFNLLNSQLIIISL